MHQRLVSANTESIIMERMSVCINNINIFLQDSSVSGLEGPYVISSRETEVESSASLRLAELERGSMVS